ncbi:hypothetical protein RND81_13G071400 [Saponaria officinalis]|uniref:Uncharacterized protein n=1 Tax=Saponaria officinalis TaxID=3572 RepID=A0AAW1GYI2_SAPOF
MVGAHQLFATMPEPTEQANASQTKCQAGVINNETAPSKVSDELTLPTFIKEMAQVASFVEESTLVSEIKADAKGFKDNSYLANDPRVFVFDPDVSFLHINEIEIGPCAKFLGLISGWKAHVNYKEVHSWDKYRSYTQFALLDQLKKVSYFRGDVTKPPILKLSVLKYNLSQVETIKESYSSGDENLSAMTTVTSTSYLVSVVGLNRDGMLYLMSLSHHENDPFQSGVAGYVRTLHHGFVTINFKKMSRSLPNHFFGHMKHPPALGHSLVNIHSHSPMDYTNMLLGYGYKDQNASIFFFYPGDFKCWLSWLKIMKILEAYQNNGRNFEDYQIYVFDPGGPLIRLVMDAMVTNPKT